MLKNLEKVREEMVEAAHRARATIVTVTFHEFNPFGISGVVVISTSHLSIHTWPEYRYAAMDIFSCGDVVQPQAAIDHLTQVFGAERISVVKLQWKTRSWRCTREAPSHSGAAPATPVLGEDSHALYSGRLLRCAASTYHCSPPV